MSDFHRTMDRKLWAVLRLKVFKRDGYRCTKCNFPGRLECDHVIPVGKGGNKYALTNLATLCRHCHLEKTRTENEKEPSGWQKFLAGMLLK